MSYKGLSPVSFLALVQRKMKSLRDTGQALPGKEVRNENLRSPTVYLLETDRSTHSSSN